MCGLCAGPCEWISLSTLRSPIPELQNAPQPLKVLWAREHVPTPPSSVVFHLDSHLSPSRSWECVRKVENHEISWKPYNHNLPTWVFFNVNNNHSINMNVIQIMWCIIYHNHTFNLKILALCTMCHKGFIICHKVNDITTMEKHVEVKHKTLFKFYEQQSINHFWSHLIGNQLIKGQM